MRPAPAALRTFLAPYDPAVCRLFLATRRAVLAAAPDANELVYDAYNAVTIAYSFTARLQEAFCHVAAYPRHVNLGFNRGAALPDPDAVLVGTGAHIRHVRIDAAQALRGQAIQHLLRAAVEQGRSLGAAAPAAARSVVQSVSARKRRPAATAKSAPPAGRRPKARR